MEDNKPKDISSFGVLAEKAFEKGMGPYSKAIDFISREAKNNSKEKEKSNGEDKKRNINGEIIPEEETLEL